MEGIQGYLITIVSAAMLSSVLLRLLKENSSAYKIIKMMCRIVMVLTVVSPFVNISLQPYISSFDAIREDSAAAAQRGEDFIHEQLSGSIKEKTEAYILDKATLLGADIHVSVTCDTSDIPIPIMVELSGSASPYARSRLRQILEQDIGVPEENQIWI